MFSFAFSLCRDSRSRCWSKAAPSRSNFVLQVKQQMVNTHAMLGLMGAFRGGAGGGGARWLSGVSGAGVLDGGFFKPLGNFDGGGVVWKEWSMKYEAAFRECSQAAFDAVTWAENEREEFTEAVMRENEGEGVGL